MELSVDDVNVKITGVKVTPSTKTADAPTVPEICEASPLPSVYPVDGINSAAMFNGTFGDEEGGLATIQYEDTFEFPTGSASYGGWSNGNQLCIQLNLQAVVSLPRRRFISVHPQLKRQRFTLDLRMRLTLLMHIYNTARFR